MNIIHNFPKANIPCVIKANDYHAFFEYANLLSSIVGKKVKFKELDTEGEYKALFWVGKKPTSTKGFKQINMR
ncbi:MAG TPA: hypothetical protein VNX68_10425 [Nitrosopumilaceae archaeon]|jgi:hypothetical protein|nr:hypothetical protein [Nitrosopumilaceae archaeon]